MRLASWWRWGSSRSGGGRQGPMGPRADTKSPACMHSVQSCKCKHMLCALHTRERSRWTRELERFAANQYSNGHKGLTDLAFAWYFLIHVPEIAASGCPLPAVSCILGPAFKRYLQIGRCNCTVNWILDSKSAK